MQAIAAFPDLHPGRHGPVGAAFLADRIYPQLVGPDIGCGMALYKLELPRRKLKIDRAAGRLTILEDGASEEDARRPVTAAGLGSDVLTWGLGTIGGGNHFCEVQAVGEIIDAQRAAALNLDKDDICLLIHTGSRNQGATIFNGIEARWKDGFATGSSEAEAYLGLHDQAVIWARLNRQLVADAAAHALRTQAHLVCDSVHNLVAPHSGAWLHRKGAAAPDKGLAPLAGSRESRSYLMAADSMPDATLGSLSHGAGRRYDRGSMHGRASAQKLVHPGRGPRPCGCGRRDRPFRSADASDPGRRPGRATCQQDLECDPGTVD
ncbi:RtcB family protein [Loktanella sp. DJP18]|uniref:RtcB family protein n=1 Tax=Loktanella sp. DJP18 TaxID=3409788 RepID=UPI003BB5595A